MINKMNSLIEYIPLQQGLRPTIVAMPTQSVGTH